jgi:hypothetical protein
LLFVAVVSFGLAAGGAASQMLDPSGLSDAIQAVRAGDLPKAERLLKTAVAAHPESPLVRY